MSNSVLSLPRAGTRFLACAASALLCLGTAIPANAGFAQELATTPPPEPQGAAPPREPPSNSGGAFADMGFGAGIAYIDDHSNVPRVEDAIIDAAGLVRITKQNNDSGRLVLEVHAPKWDAAPKRCEECKHGPFVALTSSDDAIIKGVGFGWMVSLPLDAGPISAFNIGFGYFNDSNVRTLGNGIHQDMPLPPGETEIRFKETDRDGIIVLFSFSTGSRQSRSDQ